MNVLKFEDKNTRDFRQQLRTNTPEVLDSMLGHYLDKVARLYQSLRNQREKALGELTWYQFNKYQAFHQYLDTLRDDQVETITKRKVTLRRVENCRDISSRIKNINGLISAIRVESELRKVA